MEGKKMYNSHNKDPLGKKFLCQHCGKSFRTRQGLSGHIQFKHQSDTTKPDFLQIVKGLALKHEIWKISVNTMGYPSEIAQAGDQVLKRWEVLCYYFDLLKLRLNDSDFKNFMLQNFKW